MLRFLQIGQRLRHFQFSIIRIVWKFLNAITNLKGNSRMGTNITEYISSDQLSKVIIIPALRDNYSYIIEHNKEAFIVDPSSFIPVNNVGSS